MSDFFRACLDDVCSAQPAIRNASKDKNDDIAATPTCGIWCVRGGCLASSRRVRLAKKFDADGRAQCFKRARMLFPRAVWDCILAQLATTP